MNLALWGNERWARNSIRSCWTGAESFTIILLVPTASGVFAIETKTRRKRPAPKGKEDHKVAFDGSTLHFPSYKSSDAVEQAHRNAESLSQELSRALAEPVAVKAILT